MVHIRNKLLCGDFAQTCYHNSAKAVYLMLQMNWAVQEYSKLEHHVKDACEKDTLADSSESRYKCAFACLCICSNCRASLSSLTPDWLLSSAWPKMIWAPMHQRPQRRQHRYAWWTVLLQQNVSNSESMAWPCNCESRILGTLNNMIYDAHMINHDHMYDQKSSNMCVVL